MTKNELEARVGARKREIDNCQEKLSRFNEKTRAFLNDIKSRTVIYGMIKGLAPWKALEALIEDIDG